MGGNQYNTKNKRERERKTESFIQSACEFLNYIDQAIFKPYVHVLLFLNNSFSFVIALTV